MASHDDMSSDDEHDALLNEMENDSGAIGDPLDADGNVQQSDSATESQNLEDLNQLASEHTTATHEEQGMSDQPPPDPVDPADEEEMSDDDAMALMAQMEAEESEEPDLSPSSGMTEPAPEMDGSDELSDEEAQALLAQMDGEPEPQPAEEATGDVSEEMSDDAAAALLAQMDGDPAPAAEPASGDSMSDDEAQALLAAMDAPASPAAGDASAEDDAAALLSQLGGDDDDEPATATPAAAPPTPEPAAAAPAAANDIEEIDEWEANDFQTDPDMVNDFNTNSEEITENLDEQILALENDPTNKEIVEEIFRAAHTLKGAAGMFGFKGLERVVHRMENLFDLVRKGKLTPTSDTVDVMFEAMDVVRALLEAVKDGKPCGIKCAPVVKNLELAALGQPPKKSTGSTNSSEAEGAPAEAAQSSEAGGGDAPAKKASADNKKKQEASTIRVDLNRLDMLVNLVGELVIDRTRFVSIDEELRLKFPEVKLESNISETVQLFGRHMNEIQDIIMKVRMVPIGNAFNKYPRIIRDLAKQLGKKINLHISGESAELDKTLVEQIGDPLIHLIRNSCDHGVEMPDVRIQNGKNSEGNIWLSAYQEGNHIVIIIEDDGKGIPVEIIRKKGISKGLISEDDKLSKREILNLIFEAGFSTAEQVSNISGRGVGMDVVKKQIMKLKGMLEVDSEEGKGTTITIRLPLTLAIVQSLLVRVKEEIFAIPLSSVIESIRIAPEEIQKVGESEVIKLRDRVLPLMHLDQELRLENAFGTISHHIKKQRNGDHANGRKGRAERLFVVVVGSSDRPFGILVDQLLNQQEMVIKSFGRLMQGIRCVAGGAVMGNGEVVVVLDVPELEEAFSAKNRRQEVA